MKKPKSKTKSGKSSDVKSALLPDEFPADPPTARLPTATELAMIAATLSQKIDGFHDGWDEMTEQLALAAQRLWLTSRKLLTHFEIAIGDEDAEQEKETENDVADFLRCQIYFKEGIEAVGDKIPRDLFLRAMLPAYKSRTADLARVGKAFVRHLLCKQHQKEPTKDEISQAYGGWKDVGDTLKEKEWAENFEAWYSRYVKEARRAAGLKSAQAKARKKRKARPPREKLKSALLT
jgi:hypothetical protein